METKTKIIQMLKGLFTICKASEKGYRAAADAIQKKTAKELLITYADQRKEFAEELRGEIRFHSDSDFDAAPPADAMLEIYQAIETEDEEQIIRACERNEQAFLRVYEDALSRRVPWDVETVLSHQFADIKNGCYFLNAMELFTNQFVV
jgi:uncharacterized protein (TIGR02284 family)